MGALQQHERRLVLRSRTLVGRSTASTLVIESRKVSAEHARISWSEGSWWIRDLGSRNGTLIDGKRLQPGVDRRISSGQELAFGSREELWTVDAVDPPTAIARRIDDGTERVAEDGLLPLPDVKRPLVLLEAQLNGGWQIEENGASRPVEDLEVVTIDGEQWQLSLPRAPEATCDVRRELVLRFHVSLDEEHIRLEACLGETPLDLGERAHNYLLLLLGRQRLTDASLPSGERGWVYREDLLQGLQLDPQQLNLLVFRARKSFAKAGLEPTAPLIERRLDSGQLRLGVRQVEVLRA